MQLNNPKPCLKKGVLLGDYHWKDDDFGHKHIIYTRDAQEAQQIAKQMMKLAETEVQVSTKSRQPQFEVNPDNPWTKSTPKVSRRQ